jgi:alpha-ribazole phosphatase
MPEDFVTRLFLLRHGDVEGMAAREVRGRRDVGLSARGLAQHRALVEWLGERAPLTRVIASPLGRCRDLGERLARAAGLELELAPELTEQHMGSWQGQTWDAISRSEGRVINDYWDDYWNAVPPGGESMATLSARTVAWWQAHEPELRGGRVALVTHAGVIRALLATFLGLPGGEALRFAPPPATLTLLAHSGGGFVLEGLGLGPAEAAATRSAVTAPLRIALSGSAGTGKTTLGRALAAELGLPFIEERMRLRLEAGLDLGALDYHGLEALNRDLWEEHRALELAHPGGFVCDRSSLDFAAFRLHYGFFEGEEETARFFEHAIEHAATYSHVLVFPHGVLPLEADGVRLPNPWLQLRFQLCVEGLTERHIDAARLLRVPATAELAERLAWARGAVD